MRIIFSIVLLSGLFVSGGCRRKVSTAPSTPANNQAETDGELESPPVEWKAEESAQPVERDASMVRLPETPAKTAEHIRKVISRFFREAPQEAKSNLPPDLAKNLPMDVGEVSVGPGGNIHIGVWHLSLQGDHALLIFHPPGWSSANRRIWFEVRLVRKDGAWEIVPPGVGWARAWSPKRTIH